LPIFIFPDGLDKMRLQEFIPPQNYCFITNFDGGFFSTHKVKLYSVGIFFLPPAEYKEHRLSTQLCVATLFLRWGFYCPLTCDKKLQSNLNLRTVLSFDIY